MSDISVDPLPNLKSDYTLAAWLVTGAFHPVWDQWVVSLVHLRGEIDGQPAHKEFPEATHELRIMSQHPRYRLNAHSTPKDVRALQPVDVVAQFQADTDGEAMLTVERLMRHVGKGDLSPDMDFAFTWNYLLAGGEA